MTEIIIDKKKYVLISQKDYYALQKAAALKTKPEKLFDIEEARAYSKKLIRKWATEKIIVKESAAENIAAISLYIESKGLIKTAEKFTDDVYDYLIKLSNDIKSYVLCREPIRASLGFKCVNYKKKYTIVFIERNDEIIICEFISSKLIHW